MAISETLIQLVDIRDDIRQALINKGVDMTNIPLSQYAEKIAGISTRDFPGYVLKTGELCSLAAGGAVARRSMAIPANCIPVALKSTGNWRFYSGKGETSDIGISITDNNNKTYLYVNKNSGPQWSTIGDGFCLCPLAMYEGNLETAATITTIHVNTWCNGGIYDASTGKIAVTMWLEKKV
ncbi:hypothetical protein [Holdemania massiliensis]|uniref:hypothetical protein n=1 Tax=Holdemania massiliensis TaxID=1468449 RepID=UPI00242FA99C|nr:hypothetical protein [Holdemania massiliensis]